MPYELQKSGGGYFVVNTETGEKKSKKPIPKKRAEAQMRFLYMIEKKKEADLTPPLAVQAAARKGLAWREKYQRGGLSTQEAGEQGIGSGVQRAVNLAKGDALSWDTVEKMAAFFSRHEKNNRPAQKESDGGPTAGTIAWALWGGDPGKEWANSMLASREKESYDGVVIALRPRPEIAMQIAQTYPVANGLPPEMYHVTLAYLGTPEADNLSKYQVIAALGAFLHECEIDQLKAKIGGVATFTEGVQVALVDSPDLPEFHHELVEVLEEYGIACKTEHGFTPHITLGYDVLSPLRPGAPIEMTFGEVWLMWQDEYIPFRLGNSKSEKAAKVLKTEGDEKHPASHYLVVEDPEQVSTWHLQVIGADNKPDHRLMSAAWAALHGGYRGNKYQGPNSEMAMRKLKRLYEREGMTPPGERQKHLPGTHDQAEHGGEENQSARGRQLSGLQTRVQKLYQEAGGDMKVLREKPEWKRTVSELASMANVQNNADGTAPKTGGGKRVQRKRKRVKKPKKTAPVKPTTAPTKTTPPKVRPGEEAKIDAMKSYQVFKDAKGEYRWIAYSSNAFRDLDGEIVSLEALKSDCDLADQTGNYGPLRWWHVPGADIGTCDFNMVVGRTLIESGTFSNPAIAEAMKDGEYQISIGFKHPVTEPDANGVFQTIRRFERSIVPAGKVANRFTQFATIKKESQMATLREKLQALGKVLGDDAVLQAVLQGAAEAEKSADGMAVDWKELEGTAEKADQVEMEFEMEGEEEDMTEEELSEEEKDFDEAPVIGDMPLDDFATMLAASVSAALEPVTKELQAFKEWQATTEAGIQRTAQALKEQRAAEATRLKEVSDAQSATQKALEERIQRLEAELKDARTAVKELMGDLPGQYGYVASEAADTQIGENHRLKDARPAADPMAPFFDFLNK